MRDLVRLIVWAVVDLLRSRAAIEAEILTLRQQIIVLRRTAANKQTFGAIDRLVFVGLYRLFPRILDALAIVRPGTVIKWHRILARFHGPSIELQEEPESLDAVFGWLAELEVAR